MEDKYSHCWQCGAKRVVGVKPRTQTIETSAVPKFESYEELAKPQPFIFRLFLRRSIFRRPLMILASFLLLALLKFFDSPFLGKYGLYIVIVGGILGLILILWGHFRRDPTEGSGVKLN